MSARRRLNRIGARIRRCRRSWRGVRGRSWCRRCTLRSHIANAGRDRRGVRRARGFAAWRRRLLWSRWLLRAWSLTPMRRLRCSRGRSWPRGCAGRMRLRRRRGMGSGWRRRGTGRRCLRCRWRMRRCGLRSLRRHSPGRRWRCGFRRRRRRRPWRDMRRGLRWRLAFRSLLLIGSGLRHQKRWRWFGMSELRHGKCGGREQYQSQLVHIHPLMVVRQQGSSTSRDVMHDGSIMVRRQCGETRGEMNYCHAAR